MIDQFLFLSIFVYKHQLQRLFYIQVLDFNLMIAAIINSKAIKSIIKNATSTQNKKPNIKRKSLFESQI